MLHDIDQLFMVNDDASQICGLLNDIVLGGAWRIEAERAEGKRE